MIKLSNKLLEPQLEPSSLLHTPVSIWIKQTDFLKTQDLQPFLWLRYIDDIFFIWTHGEAERKRLMEKLNQFLPNLRFTCESSQQKVAFLDLNVSSAHRDHLKNSVIYSQALRLSNICTYERFSEACTRYEIMVFGEGILKENDWFTNGKGEIRADKKSGT